MCLKMCRTPLLALVVGMYLEFTVRNGICDDTQQILYANKGHSSSSSSSNVFQKGSKPSHKSWKGWDDWMPPKSPYQFKHGQNSKSDNMKLHVPLSPEEHSRLRSRRNMTEQQQQPQHLNKMNSGASTKASSANSKSSIKREKEEEEEETGNLIQQGLAGIAQSFTKFTCSTFLNFMDKTLPVTPSSRNSRSVFLDNLAYRPDGPNHGKQDNEAKRGVINWLSRLIGVEGKSLGEFLREYQVHVLYDLAFTFFKWIFFLYAGLLIP